MDSTDAHSSEFGTLIGVNEMTFVKTFIRDESGASAAEYALILAVVGAGIAFAAFALGEAVSSSINSATEQVKKCSAGSAATDCHCFAGLTNKPTVC